MVCLWVGRLVYHNSLKRWEVQLEHFLVCFFFSLKHFYFLNLFVQITITLDTPHERVCVCEREIERIFIAYIIKRTDR